ncbi:glycosyltransferase family 2 protein [Psychroserpens sp.]|uniref:glycosyltransferase family 2 protein n=1 Tax=Psychroserpens sp. TaxID=2020870 RepID=UPI002B268F55|nr:glycosyltransferase [Psychroserpens sp.]
MNPLVSVIVPIYNVESYIHRCIDSILNQTYQNLEIILVNDVSPDNCGQICDDYASKDKRVVVIHKTKNEGSSCARNDGLDMASGDYISYVDSDDYLELSMIEIMMNHLLTNNLEVIEIVPKNLNSEHTFDDSFTIEDPITATKRVLKNSSFSVWRRIFKTSLVKDLRFIPHIIHQDVFYIIDVLKRISKNGYLNSPLYYYNTENESIIRSKYTLKKISTGIRATEYIINNVVDKQQLKESINNYITHYYTGHYFLLSRNTEIDPDKAFRKKLKKAIIHSISLKNVTFRSVLVVLLPARIMEFISSGYQSIKS